MLALLLKGHLSDKNVLFLYPEDQGKIEYARENSEEVAVVMFNPKTPHNVWRLTNEILEYPKVYYMDETNLSEITDPEVVNAKKIILYVADEDHQQEAIDGLLKSCKNLSDITWISLEDMWTTFEIN
jgi:predicted P-loop ATPase/GTPase